MHPKRMMCFTANGFLPLDEIKKCKFSFVSKSIDLKDVENEANIKRSWLRQMISIKRSRIRFHTTDFSTFWRIATVKKFQRMRIAFKKWARNSNFSPELTTILAL